MEQQVAASLYLCAISGANKCLVVDASDLDDECTPLPADNPVVENFAQVTGWLEKDDGLSDELAPQFLTMISFSIWRMNFLKR